ncbi:MAG: hypothetical protein QCI82_10865 [Candidatus Thermoplasmatota archaeon]|nr:hypothetical protein [Candidatus Thermoplasmatota archaeon]
MGYAFSSVGISVGSAMQNLSAQTGGAGETCLWVCTICCMAPITLFLIVFVMVLVRRIVRMGRRRKALAQKKAGRGPSEDR